MRKYLHKKRVKRQQSTEKMNSIKKTKNGDSFYSLLRKGMREGEEVCPQQH